MNAVCIGMPSLTTHANVTVTIVDRAMPVFDEALYSVTVPESLPQYATIVSVSAQSPASSSLVYSIIDGNLLGQFGVDFSVGKFLDNRYETVFFTFFFLISLCCFENCCDINCFYTWYSLQ